MAELTKQQVSKRLITQAAKMVISGADPIAAHIVATSALTLLKELLKKSGERFTERVFKMALFDAGSRVARGEPSGMPPQEQLDELLGRIAEAIKAGHVEEAKQLIVKNAGKLEYESLRFLVDPFNFAKHADNDPDGTIDEDAFKPAQAVAFAITAHSLVFADNEYDEDVGEFLKAHDLMD